MTLSLSASDRSRRALVVFRDDGLRGVVVRLLSAVGYRRLLLLERSLDYRITAPNPRLALRCERLTRDSFDEYFALRPDVDPDAVTSRLARGHLCHVARTDEEIVAACWSTTLKVFVDYLGCELDLGDDAAYLYDAFTAPAWRGRGVASILCAHQLSALRAEGLTRALRATWPENRSALRAHAKSGFRPVRRLTTLRLGPWRWLRDRPLPVAPV